MENCSGCGKPIHRDEPVSAAFSQDGQRRFFHKTCEGRAEYLTRWKEEAAWAFRATRLTTSEWNTCSPRKHVGVWQSIFIARRDEDVWCPDCGLKIARHEAINCPTCGGRVIITNAETTQMVFSHREPLYKLQVHCTERGDDSFVYAIISGYTPVTITSKKGEAHEPSSKQAMMLKYEPKGDPKRGLTV
jgi:DNA-directed RNA polymerase subunit RPC12/RpoP